MARKKKKPMPGTALHEAPPSAERQEVPPAKRSTKDRHRPRRTIAYKPDVYLLMQRLATKINKRPLIWEAEIIAISHLEDAGLWPADPALLEELRRKDEEGEEG